MGLKRRGFLQQVGVALTALGVSQTGLWRLCDRYQTALAEPARRKLALLVGINQYPGKEHLEGCITDVELQRELLIHRFGFGPDDILTLINQDATRAGIESAFMTHLVEQAQPGDAVVFHFSGYGSQLTLPGQSDFSRSLVVVDEPLPNSEQPIMTDLLEETLWLMVRSLQTNRVTTVLDTSYAYPGNPLQGGLRIRSYANPSAAQPSELELAFQAQLRHRISPDAVLSAVGPGVVLAAAGNGQLATEARWSGFSAGLFTYALTQALWQATPASKLYVSFRQAAEQVGQLVSYPQQPQFSGPKHSEVTLQSYAAGPVTSLGADGAVITVDETQTLAVWLGGLPATLLEQYGVNSRLSLVDAPAKTETPTDVQIQLTAREGLMAKAKLYTPTSELSEEVVIQPGQLVREQTRVLPRSVGLTIALDSSLGRVERVDAVSALSTVPHISTTIAGEQPADYLFSKMRSQEWTQVATLSPTVLKAEAESTPAGYGLFSLGRDVIPNTAGEGGEAIKVAIKRLTPKLQTLLAAKLLSLTVNEGTSRLGVRTTLERLGSPPQALQQRYTLRAPWRQPASAPNVPLQADGLLSLPAGSRIQYRVENYSPNPIYFILLGLDTSGNLISLQFPTALAPEPSTNLSGFSEAIRPGNTVVVPPVAESFQWVLRNPSGLAESYLIFSRLPFNQTFTALTAGLQPLGDVPAVLRLSNPLAVAQAVLQDLHLASRSLDPSDTPDNSDTVVLDVNAWATLRFSYQVV